MAYRPSTARYSGGGKTKYLVYESPQPLRTGKVQQRTRVQRLYFPASASDITLEGPKTVSKRTGKRVFGALLHYRSRLGGTTAHRGATTYKVPPRESLRTKAIELPRGATDLRLTDKPPEGPRMAVA